MVAGTAHPPSSEWLNLKQAAERLGGITVHSLRKWADEQIGVRVSGGRRVVLKTFKVGRTIYTTQTYIDQFIAEQQPVREQDEATPGIAPSLASEEEVPEWATGHVENPRLQ